MGHPLSIVVSVILWMGKLWNQLVGQLFQGFINKISSICMIVGPGNHRKPEFSSSGAVHKVPDIFFSGKARKSLSGKAMFWGADRFNGNRQ